MPRSAPASALPAAGALPVHAPLAENGLALELHAHDPPARRATGLGLPLTLEVTLNPRDASIITALAEEDYRTPAQQVGWIVAQWLKLHASVVRTATATQSAATPDTPVAPDPTSLAAVATLIPVYHVGDGSAGSGCGKVGLFFRRPITDGDRIGPADIVLLDGSPLSQGGLVCGHCGAPFTMSPRNWRAGHEES